VNILVTGASGMFGKVLAKRLLKGNQVLGISKSGNHQTVICDLTRPEEVERLFQGNPLDLVIHTAAYSNVDGCELHPELAYQSNTLATKYLATNCGRRRVPLITISTDYVFDGRKTAPYKENDPTCPINVYGMTKLAGEHYTRKLACVSATLRTSWLFGPDNPDNFVNAIVRRLQKEKTVSVLDDQEDSPTSVEDLAEATAEVGKFLTSFHKANPKKDFYEIFQFCNSGSVTRYDMTLKIKKCLRLKSVEVRRLDRQSIQKKRVALRPPHSVMSTQHFQKTFKKPVRHWQASLEEYLLERLPDRQAGV